MKVWLLLFSLIALATSLSCEAYILKMVQLYYNDKPQCKHYLKQSTRKLPCIAHHLES